MISYDPKNWIHLIFALNKSDTIRMLWKEIVYIAIHEDENHKSPVYESRRGAAQADTISP